MKNINANILNGKYEEILAGVQSPVITLTELIKNAADSCKNRKEPIIVDILQSDKTIKIIDKGIGISEKEIQHLGEAGYSSKMIGDNTLSPINNPYSGSKGLGLLTAFFIAEELEMITYSEIDKKAYHIVWKKGEQRYSYEEIKDVVKGTTVLLKNVDDEKMKMILLPEEKVKLFMTSLRFYNDDPKLPKISLKINGQEECFYPQETMEEFYQKNKADNKGFVAKASFKFSDNVITLSYEDNISGFYTFNEKNIDLKDKKSIIEFSKSIKVPETGVAPIKKICESDLFESDYVSVNVPDFSGVFYTWRNQKDEELEQWPVGVRIYVNNYSLYRYLDKDNDWLNLSEVSQNVKATNYKLKNTYGYLDINDYNENEEYLKISKERNDFVDSLAQRKFFKIMRDVIVTAFTRIDIAVKNPPVQSLSIRKDTIIARLNEKIVLRDNIICQNIGLDEIILNFNKSDLNVDSDWNVTAYKAGSYTVEVSYNKESYDISLVFKEKIPEFTLKKTTIDIYKGNSENLRNYIDIKSCKDVEYDEIVIMGEEKTTIVKNDLFDMNNSVGQHVILFKYKEFQKTLFVNVKEIEHTSDSGAKLLPINSLFPQLEHLQKKSYRLPELINAISAYYNEAPTLCMAAIRILIESSCKSFFEFLKEEEVDIEFYSLVSKILNLRDCNEESPDYKKYINEHSEEFITEFKNISKNYDVKLSKDVKKNINNRIREIDLNMFIHNPKIIATDITVYTIMQVIAPLLNYIYDILLIEQR